MSKLLENKQIIHVASEIVVLTGITFYFSQKNKKLVGHIEDLSERLEEQEDLIQKHEQVIRKLVEFVNKQSETPKNSHVVEKQPPVIKRSKKPRRKEHVDPPLSPPPVIKQKPRVQFNTPIEDFEPNLRPINEMDEYSSEHDSDLDAEIEEELEDLDDVIEFDTEHSLKNTNLL